MTNESIPHSILLPHVVPRFKVSWSHMSTSTLHISDRVLNYAWGQLRLYIDKNTHISKKLCLIQVVCHHADVGLIPSCSMWDSL
jgi:hypothetical protein